MGNEIFENHFKYFLAKNERRMNGLFGHLLWYCCLVGPIIAVGVILEAFRDITLGACLQAFLIALAFAIGHTLLYKFKPESSLIKYLGLIGLFITIYTMCVDHIGIYLSYFFVPMTSLLYCSRKTYVTMSILGYIVLLTSNWQIAEYMAGLRTDVDAVPWYIGVVGGETIEFLIMFASGFIINKLMIRHLQTMYGDEIALSRKEHEAYTDVLTGLWNRRYIEHAFEKYVVVQRNAGAMLVVDLDHMKSINDKLGHLEGDRALKLLGDILRKSFSKSASATICRFGGDEFVVLLPGVQASSELCLYMSQLFAYTEEYFYKDPKFKALTLSVGAAFINDSDMNYESVFERADKALYQVKNSGKNSYQIYNET